MIVDRQALLSDEQAVTATAFTTDAYDLGAGSPSRDIGTGNHIRAVCTVDEAAAAAGAATVAFELGVADDAAGTNFTALTSIAALGKATLTLGYKVFDVQVPSGGARRYLLGRYTVATGPLTAGKFSMALVLNSDNLRSYATGYPNPFA